MEEELVFELKVFRSKMGNQTEEKSVGTTNLPVGHA